MHLRSKFSFMNFVLIAAIVAGVSCFIYRGEKMHLKHELYVKLETDIKKFANVCNESSLTEQYITLYNYIKTLMDSNEGVAYAIYADRTGLALIHSDLSFRGKLLQGEIDQRAGRATSLETIEYDTDSDIRIREAVFPVLNASGRAGTARIGYNVRKMEEPMEALLYRTSRRIAHIALIGMILGFVVSYLIVYLMTKPIQNLTTGAQLIGEGKLDHRIAVRSRDELGILSQEFNKMASKLQELDEMKDDFVSSVSHELRSPIIAIRNYVENLGENVYGEATQDQKRVYAIIVTNIQRLNSFISNVLDVSKMKSGTFELSTEEVELRPLTDETIAIMKALADEANLLLQVSISVDMPRLSIDKDKIKQVIINLVGNAIKFTPSGGSITVTAIRHSAGFVRVSVTDTGIGIPQDKFQTVFEKFSQIKDAQKTMKKAKGTGLGLAISRSIVLMHGGDIWVESSQGKGSTFNFTLPVHRA
ncbi:MAG: hypothetical protein A2293_09240 [Elusimicrobia bacterium RIFOXYB2_FULL_49_7]|nr:MAG: hypothetical protein A2293_09240 [Elusimicrobia bacterium RIFOXYB2_FULL_49_7]